MSPQLSLEEITAILLNEHQSTYSGSIPPKAFNKVLYFAAKELEDENVTADIPYFWYMYGTEVKTANTGIRTISTGSGQRIQCDTSIEDIQASHGTVRKARKALSRSLDKYYRKNLEGITDEMYEEAPYDVQRIYRELDTQIEVAADSSQATLFGDNNRKQIRRNLLEFVQAFPTADFPAYEDDLMIWYRVMRAELNDNDFDAEEVDRLATKFWRLFCLELACRENNGVSRKEIEAERDISDIEAEKEAMRADLLERERTNARQNARDSETALQAAEAFVVPFLDIEVTG
ncbi:hypothetical protein [Halocalculus aciditolerans]|uniref:Uncharacterized protein n=1 Tax=Halocalculus aciditolerans TaxID=1383812 RepID=A0A830FMF3_9EURY|nr:hypothetical protein [Halocalculus aciditolerans]GGL67103.1 hypothetical protein GCM10009039_26360 [Halocalculus aciditolerans]